MSFGVFHKRLNGTLSHLLLLLWVGWVTWERTFVDHWRWFYYRKWRFGRTSQTLWYIHVGSQWPKEGRWAPHLHSCRECGCLILLQAGCRSFAQPAMSVFSRLRQVL